MLDEKAFNQLADRLTRLEKIVVKNGQTNEVNVPFLTITGTDRDKKYRVLVNDVDPGNLTLSISESGQQKG